MRIWWPVGDEDLCGLFNWYHKGRGMGVLILPRLSCREFSLGRAKGEGFDVRQLKVRFVETIIPL